jgi:hypothetical protein
MYNTDEQKEQVIDQLKAGIVEVTFNKVNGDQRIMTCTLKADKLPEVKVNESTNKPKKVRKQNPDVCSVFDINAEGWRSFRWDKLTNVNAINV